MRQHAGSTSDGVADDRRVLRIYLGDHLAMMRGGAALVGRMRGGGHHAAHGDLLGRAAAELDAGQETAVVLLRQLGSGPPLLKLAAATVAERLGRGKLNGRIATRSPLSDVLELEGLGLVLLGSAALWRALERAEVAADGLVRGHAERCEGLAAEVEEARLGRAADVLGTSSGSVPR